MSNFPNSFDDDTTLPAINDNISEIGGDAINALRDFAFNTELYLGLGGNGTTPSISQRLGVSILPDGTINPSAIASLGLVTLPITQDQIADNAQIPESKLRLDYRTNDLFNYIQDLSKDVNLALGWISITGVKLEPHLIGALYRHTLSDIDVSHDLVNFPYLQNKFRLFRDNSQSYNLISDINSELLAHQWADGSPFGVIQNVFTNDGSAYPSNYAHVASGIFLDTTRFAVIPQTAQSLQLFADFIDAASILTLGTRIQNLYANGISRHSTSSSLIIDGYGAPIVPPTPAVAYLKNIGNLNIPFDNIDSGDDIIQFFPPVASVTNNTFDEQFALVNPGDIIRINYGADGYNVEVAYIISEKKYNQFGINKTYLVRIAGKNIAYAPNAIARIDRDLFNTNKYGVLAAAGVNSPTNTTPSLIIGSPRGAQCLGVGFSPDQFDEAHYLLYLALYLDGNPLDGYTVLPAIDVTGNAGITPGAYTLDSIVNATNIAFRAPGFNYRFIAFAYQGEFGIMLADSYNNAGFSIITGVVGGDGFYDQTTTQLNYPNNVIDLFPAAGETVAQDPLGLGPFTSNLASPLPLTAYITPQAALNPTKLFVPLRRNNYYVDGNEIERLNLDISQTLDAFGDGYWVATIESITVVPGSPGHVSVTYTIPLNLSASNLKVGKTIVVQPLGTNAGLVNYGRFIIQSVSFPCCPSISTQIQVFDGVHARGLSPAPIAPVGTQVAIYFNSDSVSFNAETATDFSEISPFKRHFEVLADGSGNTFTHERGRFYIGGTTPTISVNGSTLATAPATLATFDMVEMSPKLRGYPAGFVTKIGLFINSYSQTTGVYTGFLASYQGPSFTNFTNAGPIVSGHIGEITRFYDETNIDFIDITLDINSILTSFTNQVMEIQLFPTLSLDGAIMMLATCQLNDTTQIVSQFIDQRQFGNTSEEEFTTSARDFISLPERLLHFNGVVRGFDITGGINNEFISLNGGLALVNGNFQAVDQQTFTVPIIQEVFSSTVYGINFALCVNSGGDLVVIPLTDYDPNLPTPNDPNRVMTVQNQVTLNNYSVDSTTFSYLLNNRKDLTILYIVSSVVVGTGSGAIVTLTTRDVRRFINDADASIPAVLVDDNSQGNFRSLDAALNWLKFNNLFQDDLEVKGAFAINQDPGLNFPLNITGQGLGAQLTFNITINIFNVTFQDMTIIFNSPITLDTVNFNNCVVISAFTITTSQTTMRDSNFTLSAQQPFALGNGCTFTNCHFSYTANPVGSGDYTTADLANVSSGMMYANVASSLSNLIVRDCTFTNSFSDHRPFISIQLSTTSSIVENVDISNNKFTSFLSVNDVRAVIAFTSTITAPPGSVYPAAPKLVNVNIEKNVCNYDQMILISTVRANSTDTSGDPPVTGAIQGPMLACTNCNIEKNICGTIGFITANDSESQVPNSDPINGGFIRNKLDHLNIENNTCQLITNLDYRGAFIPFAFGGVSWVYAPTGPVSIINNSAYWIVVGTSSLFTVAPQGVIISKNRLSPGGYPSSSPNYFLNNFVDTLNSGAIPNNVGIALLREMDTGTLLTLNLIEGNNISEPQIVTSSGIGVFPAPNYNAAIFCSSNAQILNNIIGSVVGSGLGNSLISLYDLGTMTVRGNYLNRLGGVIQAYIQGPPHGVGENTVNIDHNIFDSQTPDNTSNTKTGFNIPKNWVFCENINQTSTIAISLADYARAITSLGNSSGNLNGPASGNGSIYGSDVYTVAATWQDAEMFAARILHSRATGIGANYLQIGESNSGHAAASRNASFYFPLDYILPEGVQIVNANIGILLQAVGGGALDTSSQENNQATLSLISYNDTLTSNSVMGVLDVAANTVGGADNSEAIIQQSTVIVWTSRSSGANTNGVYNIVLSSDATSATQYCPIVVSSPNSFITANGHKIGVEFTLNYLRQSLGSTALVNWNISPIVITFVWV